MHLLEMNTNLSPSFQENYNEKGKLAVTSLNVWKIKPKPCAQEKLILLRAESSQKNTLKQ